MSQDELISFFVALFIGALVGTERTLDKRGLGQKYIGLRSFILISQMGALCGWLAHTMSTPWILLIGLIGLVALLGISYWQQYRNADTFPGLITEFAAVVVFLLSAASILGHLQLAVALGIITTGLLALKETLHKMAGRVRSREFLAALQLMFATFLILPSVPNRYIDPWEAINPRRLWLLVILICSLSMLGYIATRFFGRARGIAFTGFFGGLVSSTSVTLNFSREARAPKAFLHFLAVGILISWVVMSVRTMGLILLLVPDAFETAGPGLGLLALPAGVAALILGRQVRRREVSARRRDAPVFANPFELWAAIQFAFVFGGILLLTKWASLAFDFQGVYFVAILGGIADIDAVALSMSQVFTGAPESAVVVGHAILLAALANTVSKAAIVLVLARGRIRLWILGVTILSLLFGALGWFVAL